MGMLLCECVCSDNLALTAKGDAQGYVIKDPEWLKGLAEQWGVATDGERQRSGCLNSSCQTQINLFSTVLPRVPAPSCEMLGSRSVVRVTHPAQQKRQTNKPVTNVTDRMTQLLSLDQVREIVPIISFVLANSANRNRSPGA